MLRQKGSYHQKDDAGTRELSPPGLKQLFVKLETQLNQGGKKLNLLYHQIEKNVIQIKWTWHTMGVKYYISFH